MTGSGNSLHCTGTKTRPPFPAAQRPKFAVAPGDRRLNIVSVRPLPRTPGRVNAPRGLLIAGALALPCAIGKGGVGVKKREGDAITPLGRHKIRYWLRRPEFLAGRPLAKQPIRPNQGWCDDSRSFAYNRPVALPFRGSCERLWRADGLYDLIGVLDYNMRPRILDRGSAIFLHLAKADLSPTAGCLALRRADLRRLLPRLNPAAIVRVLR